MKTEKMPLVSIIFMVFNAERFLRKTIESLLAQDYQNLEIFICDNASEDSSGDICEEYAKKDKRIKYFREDKNIVGGSGLKAFNLASGKYLMWAADHDLWAPAFISKLVKVLEEEPKTVLCYPKAIMIDENDVPLPVPLENIDTRGLTTIERFKKIIWEMDWCNMFYGLYRLEVLHKVTLNRLVLGTDRVLMAELSLYGSVAQVIEPLFYSRKNRPDESPQKATERRMQWLSETEGFNQYDILIPRTVMAYEHIKVIESSDLTNDEKTLLSNETIRCFKKRFKKTIGHESELLVKDGLDLLTGQNNDHVATCVHALNLIRLTNIVQLFYPENESLKYLRGICFTKLGLSEESKEPFKRKVESLIDAGNVQKLLLLLIKRETAITEKVALEKASDSSKQMEEKKPLVSIGLTVFNAKRFLRKTIESLLAQDYRNIEIIISDNASEDGSSDICQEYAKRDKRIKYIRNHKNMGSNFNSYQAFKLTAGEYFICAADHDLWAPDFISKCLSVLTSNPSVILCYGRTMLIDENDSHLGLLPDIMDTRGLTPFESFKKMVWELSYGNMCYGLYRRKILDDFSPLPSVVGVDLVLACRMSLVGSIAQIDEPLWFRRRNREVELPKEAVARQKENVCSYGTNLEQITPYLMMANEHMKSVNQGPLSEKEKTILRKEVINSCTTRFEEFITNEIKEVVKHELKLLAKQPEKKEGDGLDSEHLLELIKITKIFYPTIPEVKILEFIEHIKNNSLDLSNNAIKEVLEIDPSLSDLFKDIQLNNREGIITNKSALEKKDNSSKQMKEKEPLVSIGLPVYNGKHHIEKTIISLLEQDYRNIELIISDNASDDGTSEICEKFANKEKRIKYNRNVSNEGMGNNFIKVFKLSRGKYFMWAACGDLWEPSYVPSLIEQLEKTPSAVLAVSKIGTIDANNNKKEDFFHPLPLSTIGMSKAERLIYMLKNVYGHLIYGIFNRTTIAENLSFITKDIFRPLQGLGSDVLIILRFINIGDLVVVNKRLFYYRTGGESIKSGYSSTNDIMRYYGEFANELFECFDIADLSSTEIYKLQKAILDRLIKRAESLHGKKLEQQIIYAHNLTVRGEELLSNREIEKAIIAFEGAIKMEQRCAKAHYHLGIACNQNNYNKARRHLEKAVEYNPSDMKAQQALNKVKEKE